MADHERAENAQDGTESRTHQALQARFLQPYFKENEENPQG